MKVKDPLRSTCRLLLAITLGVAGTASGTPILPGFDLLETGAGASVDLTGFNPACGIIPLQGVPLDAATLGDTDTIVERIDGIDPFDPPAGVGTVDIELVALHLVSAAPVPVGCIGVPADLHVTINESGVIPGLPQPDPLPPSLGTMEIRHEGADPDGGNTFDSCLGNLGDPGACAALGVVGGGVFGNAIFTVPGGDPANPGDVLLSIVAPRIALDSVNSTWSHLPPPNYPFSTRFPSGGFFVIIVVHVGPHPAQPAPVGLKSFTIE